MGEQVFICLNRLPFEVNNNNNNNRKNGSNPSFVLLVLSKQKTLVPKMYQKVDATLHNNVHYFW